jgi:peptidoglycan hydrolase CwlO-like protein
MRADVAEREAVMKSDMKVLAKEVKKLRKENVAAVERAAAAEARAEEAERNAAMEEKADAFSAEACHSVVAVSATIPNEKCKTKLNMEVI